MSLGLVFAGVSAGLFLLAMPVYLQIVRDDDAFQLTVSIAFLRFRKTNMKHRRKKTVPEPKTLQILIKNGYPILCRLLRRIRTDEITLHFTAAFPEPTMTAMVYALAGIVMDELYRMRPANKAHMNLTASVDFDRHSPVVRMDAVLSLRLFRLVGASVLFGAGVLHDLLRANRKGDRNDGCASAGKPDDRCDG